MRIKVARTVLLSILSLFFIVTSVSAQNENPNHNGEQDAPHCRAMGMADGSPHVDPPQNVLDQVKAEYEANCQAGNCFLGEGNYQLLESMGHTREKIRVGMILIIITEFYKMLARIMPREILADMNAGFTLVECNREIDEREAQAAKR